MTGIVGLSEGGEGLGGWLADNITARVCAEQDETGEDDAMFILEEGATLANVCLFSIAISASTVN